MFQKRSDLIAKSKLGIYLFWCKILLVVLHLITFGFSIYGIIATCNSYWLNIIGSGLLALSVITMILSISAFSLILLGLIGINMPKKLIIFIIYVIIVLVDLVINYIILGLSTESKYLSNYVALYEYCTPYYNDTNSTSEFCNKYTTSWSLKQFSRYRTIMLYDIFAGVSAPLTIVILFFIVLVILQPDAFDKLSPDTQPLDPQSNDPNAQHIADPENPDANNDANQPENANNNKPANQQQKSTDQPAQADKPQQNQTQQQTDTPKPQQNTANNAKPQTDAGKPPTEAEKPPQNAAKPNNTPSTNPQPQNQEYEYEYIEYEEEEEEDFVPQ